MRFSVSHETLYRYAAPVWLAPHLLRLTPRLEGVEMVSRELVVEPAPTLWRDSVDAFGNLVTHVEFDGATEVLRIASRFALDARTPAPLNPPDLPGLPWTASHDPASYLAQAHPDADVSAFAGRSRMKRGDRRSVFLSGSTARFSPTSATISATAAQRGRRRRRWRCVTAPAAT